ncbi:extracellular solute-binding protein [Paenibacillus sp. J5C_2022]|uniref:extracellular solute-binding protein n=1 Tax=Paenibacillus sp. J5C2022 TaxID=2977129 RepID=UPI0021D1B4FA|nr:extracellular solute-binding protein [Paenibacillus sp. J5C2022]MCU6712670.1 extracellular solute-binding protein [Paenibacillus sp. J5C2022]
MQKQRMFNQTIKRHLSRTAGRRLLLICLCFIAISALAGCKESPSGSMTQQAGSQGSSSGGMQAGSSSSVRTPPSSMESAVSFVVFDASRTFPEGLDDNHNPYLEYIERHTGVDITIIAPPYSSYQEKLNLIMASDAQPDLINTSDPAWVSRFVEEEALMPLGELLEQYGSELLEAFPKEAWDAVTFNGDIYAVPSLAEVSGNEVMYARKDWLDALGLDPPVTLEEYYEVMRAFTYDDPDGNGRDDTWGITIMPAGLSRTAPFFGAFGVPRSVNGITQWKEVDGELVYSGILPETKEALSFLAKLYGDGMLDREFILNKNSTFINKIVNGSVGMFSATWFDTRGPILDNMNKDPNAQWIRLPYPVGEEGQSGTAERDLLQSYSVIPARSANAKEVIKVLSFIAGDGYRDLKLGFQGEVWHLEDGVMVTDEGKHNEHIYRGTLHAIADPNDPAVRKERLDSLGKQYEMNDNVEYVLAHVLRSDFRGPPTPSMGRYGTKLQKLEDEAFTQIIMGISQGNAFDEFVKQWIREGGWEISNEVNAWFRDSKAWEGQRP